MTLTVLVALTMPEASDGMHWIEFASEGVRHRIRRSFDWLLVSRQKPDGSFDDWHREGTVDVRDADLPCTLVPHTETCIGIVTKVDLTDRELALIVRCLRSNGDRVVAMAREIAFLDGGGDAPDRVASLAMEIETLGGRLDKIKIKAGGAES